MALTINSIGASNSPALMYTWQNYVPRSDFPSKHIQKEFMQTSTQTAPLSKTRLWAGRILSGLPALFLLLDGVMKLIKPAPVVEGTVRLGYPESVILGLGIVLITCTVLYLIPRTSISARSC
jgi:hypothetical protein